MKRTKTKKSICNSFIMNLSDFKTRKILGMSHPSQLHSFFLIIIIFLLKLFLSEFNPNKSILSLQ